MSRVSLVFFLSIAISAAATPQTAQPVQRDPQAITVLSRVVNTAGGAAAIAAIQDFTATGQITYYWGEAPVQGTVSIKGRGLTEFRLDATLSDGIHTCIIGNGTTFQRNPDGSTSPLPSQNNVKPAVATFPLLELPVALQDTTVSLTYVGLVTHNGQQAQQVRVQRVFPTGSDPLGARSRITRADFFIDPNAFTILSVQDRAYQRNNGPGESTHEMQFSSYQAVSGVLVPFSVTELIGGQQTFAVQLSQVTFNSGLTDSNFE